MAAAVAARWRINCVEHLIVLLAGCAFQVQAKVDAAQALDLVTS